MKHSANVNYDGGFSALAEELGNLRYDALAEFLQLLQLKLRRDADADAQRQRVKLAACLKRAADAVGQAAAACDEAWRICAPHMNEAAERDKT